MKDLVIFGTGDLAQVAWAYFSRDSDYRVAAFTVDDSYVTGDSLLNLPVIPFSALEREFPQEKGELFVAMGFKRLNRARAEVYDRCKAAGYKLATYVSSKISQCGDWSAGDNCFILEQNVIQPFVTIGNNVVLWSGNHIGHHATIEDHCFITSHVVLSGRARVGAYTYMGVNSAVKHGATIAPRCLIGAGALILRDTKEGELYAVPGTQASDIPAERAARLL
jgi:sugar O-acyltransferase (sialic acid O-acetyltransferase NeuD family)